jgi:hypothetical protein
MAAVQQALQLAEGSSLTEDRVMQQIARDFQAAALFGDLPAWSPGLLSWGA